MVRFLSFSEGIRVATSSFEEALRAKSLEWSAYMTFAFIESFASVQNAHYNNAFLSNFKLSKKCLPQVSNTLLLDLIVCKNS